ncbi:MAG: hypothetical protein WBH73_08765 [Arcanobacterium sp.]
MTDKCQPAHSAGTRTILMMTAAWLRFVGRRVKGAASQTLCEAANDIDDVLATGRRA